MYAVIETGGKQYRVEVGTELEVERLEAEAGQSVTLGRVLLVADGDRAAIGRPLVAEAQVSAEVVRQGRGEKLIVLTSSSVPAQGTPACQEGPSPGAHAAAHQRHRVGRQECC